MVYIPKYEGERRWLEKSKGEKRGEILQSNYYSLIDKIVAKMVINLNPHNCWFYERRDDEPCSQFQGCIYHFLSKVCEIILISPSDFFDQDMHFETLEHSGELMPRFAGHNGAKGTVLKSTAC